MRRIRLAVPILVAAALAVQQTACGDDASGPSGQDVGRVIIQPG